MFLRDTIGTEAQLVEQETFNLKEVGSNPTCPTKTLMRNKRIQKRKAVAQKSNAAPEYAPDLFGKENPELVEAEAAREYECPCCTERSDDHELEEYERWYLENNQRQS